ncbi:MAG: two-component regulator propeller domain-containing protein [Flavobacteriaceae bacterium]
MLCNLFVLLMTTVLSSQTLPQIEVLTTEQGLSFRDVRSIAQDTSGYMWFGTLQGLNRYDGYFFKVYDSNKDNSNYIETIKIHSNISIANSTNNLWYVAEGRIFRMELQTDSITTFSIDKGVKGVVLMLYIDELEQIWIITEDYRNAPEGKAKQYLQKYDGNNGFVVFAETQRGIREFTHVTTDAEGNVCWGTILRGVLKFSKDGKLLSEKKIDSYNWYGTEMYFGQSFFDKRNNHYFFSKRKGNEGVLKLNKTTKKFENFLDVPYVIYHAIEDHQGSLWFAASQHLYRIDSEGNFQDYTKELKKHFDFTRINALYQDSNKLLWVATDNGLFKIRIKKELFSQLFKSDHEGWGNSFRSIFETENGNIIAMCENQNKLIGIDTLGNEFEIPVKHTIKNAEPPLYSSRFFAFNKDKTAVYSVTDNLIKIKLKDGMVTKFSEFNSRLNISSFNPLLDMKDGRLLFGYSLSKLTIFNPETNESRLVFPDLEQEKEILDFRYFLLSNDDNAIWVGTSNSGLLKINLNGTLEAIYNTKSSPALSNNNILVLFEENQKLWIGTYGGGLDCFILSENKIVNFKKKQGLSNNNVVGILPNQEDFLWLSTYNGLSLFNKKTKSFQNFFEEDGLTHNEFNYSSFFIDSKGNYYFGGMNGITVFDPKPILQKTEVPPLRFTNYTRFSSRTNLIYNYDWSQQKISEIEMTPYDQYFTVNWTMPNYFQNSKNQYYTKLEGFEDRWFFQGNSASIRYNKLPAGDYTLRIRGSDSNGNFSDEELELPISVKQIFFKTWWFISLLFLVVFGITYSVFNYRIQQLKAMDDLRTKISSDLHDDVGSLLSGLAMQTEMLELNASEKDKSKLQRITIISREAIDKMRDLVWSIDNRRERVQDLIERMNELADEQLLPNDIAYQINNGNLSINNKLPITVKQELFFIYKEAITNIIRHSNADRVIVSFKNNSGLGLLKITDNGTKSKHNSKTGLGMENMKMRAEKINAEINFYNVNGFTILVKLPFAF